MSDKSNSPVAEVKVANIPRSGQPVIKWDDSNLKSSYANVCNVASTREELVLLFGIHQAWNNSQKEIPIQLTERVIISPFAAKRLAILLNNTLADYERRYGVLDGEGRNNGASEK
jgi:hypothetical protein